jgi:type I restriction-modification system DNA methylase subunit
MHELYEKQRQKIKMTELEHRRKQRRKSTGEDFTPPELVCEMLDKLPKEVWAPEKTFIDNSAGTGAFLVEVLSRKLALNHPPLEALSTIYGVELMQDNVEEMKQRLFDTLLEFTPDLDDTQKAQAIDILNHNIICHNALTWDFENWKSNEHHAKSLF